MVKGFNRTKSRFLEYLKDASSEDLETELKDLELSLIKAQIVSRRFQNPYGSKTRKGDMINVKMVKWKIKQLKQRG